MSRRTKSGKRYEYVDCSFCGGHGLRWSDWDGADDCIRCGGGGHFVIYESDRLAAWPGGPLAGSEPGGYKAARKQRLTNRRMKA